MNYRETAAAITPELVELRRHFHRHPELSGQEYETAAKIEGELENLGIEHRRIGDTGVLGIIRGQGRGNRVVVLRADIDALPMTDRKTAAYKSAVPGVMHACGHDAHIAALLGAARLLQDSRKGFGGEIRLFFQQAEEVGAGAKQFIQQGLMEGVYRVFGIHAASDIPVGRVGVRVGANNASVDHFRITVKGKAAHVSTPERGVDALYIASQTVVALQAVITRQVSPVEPALIGIGTLHTGQSYNIVAERAELEGTVRTVSRSRRDQLRAQVEQAARQTAGLYGGTATVQWTDYASPLINDPQVCQEVGDVVSALWSRQALVSDRQISLAGDDFAELLLAAPGAYAYVGTGNAQYADTVLAHHTDRFDIDEDALPIAAGLYAQCAYQWLK